MGYFNFFIIRKIINSLFRYIRKNKKFIIIFIIFVCILFIKEKCFALTSNGDNDIYIELVDDQLKLQNQFVLISLAPYFR